MVPTKRLHQINSSRIFQEIWLNRGKSRIAIAEELNLDRSTITKVVRQLLEYGIVRTTGKYHGKPGAGRMATGLEIDPEFALVLGIEVQTEFFRSALVSFDGTIIHAETVSYEGNDLEPEISSVIESQIKLAQKAGKPLAGIGIGLSGIVDPYRGVILQSNPLGIREPLPLRDLLQQRFGCPVFLENDANCCCWGEKAFHRAPSDRNFLALLGEFRNIDIHNNRVNGVAVGLGIVIRDTVLHGDSFTVGEFQSLLYDTENPGRSQFSISDEEAERLPEDEAILDRVFYETAYNISLLANTLDITRIVIAGDFVLFAEQLSKHLETQIKRNWSYPGSSNCVIAVSPDKEQSVCLGAAGLFIQKLFSVPEMTDHIEEPVGTILLDRIIHQFNSLGLG
ncbi:MAG TPA: ROK family transcriptional regulator [Treponema sp.]|nr:ROK family transcriptional regulator [Treponema sp.]